MDACILQRVRGVREDLLLDKRLRKQPVRSTIVASDGEDMLRQRWGEISYLPRQCSTHRSPDDGIDLLHAQCFQREEEETSDITQLKGLRVVRFAPIIGVAWDIEGEDRVVRRRDSPLLADELIPPALVACDGRVARQGVAYEDQRRRAKRWTSHLIAQYDLGIRLTSLGAKVGDRDFVQHLTSSPSSGLEPGLP